MRIGETIRALRRKQNLTQAALAEKLFVTSQAVSQWERGITIPDAAKLNEIPRELDEAACIDGCGTWGVFWRIIFPLMKPAVATVGIYTFLQCWNELMFANIFISKNELRTLPVGVQALSGQYTTEWGPIGAALVLATFPMLFIYIFLSKKIQDSFVAGAIKG